MNTKLKLLNCNANIYFNTTCLEQNVIPKYARIKVNSHKKSIVEHAELKIQNIRIKNKTKFWYAKKQNLNKVLHTLHLQNANESGNLWNIINQNFTKKYKTKSEEI
jgi:hypothetical protein